MYIHVYMYLQYERECEEKSVLHQHASGEVAVGKVCQPLHSFISLYMAVCEKEREGEREGEREWVWECVGGRAPTCSPAQGRTGTQTPHSRMTRHRGGGTSLSPWQQRK